MNNVSIKDISCVVWGRAYVFTVIWIIYSHYTRCGSADVIFLARFILIWQNFHKIDIFYSHYVIIRHATIFYCNTYNRSSPEPVPRVITVSLYRGIPRREIKVLKQFVLLETLVFDILKRRHFSGGEWALNAHLIDRILLLFATVCILLYGWVDSRCHYE